MILMNLLRATSVTEGISYLLLLFVAMPLKYVWGFPEAVKIAGWVHGLLFMLLALLGLLAMLRARLPFRDALVLGLASLVPAGTFFTDRRLKEHQATLGTNRGSLQSPMPFDNGQPADG